MTTTLGIDLGTTSSRVAIMNGPSPAIIENSEGEGTTPSYVALTDNGLRLVGEAARRYALGHPGDVVFAVKRLMGRKYSDPIVNELKRFMPFQIVEAKNGDAWVRLGNQNYAPDQITAFILQKMKKTAEDYLGQSVARAVITVPAYFNDQQRQSTRDAAAIAGLKVVHLNTEPTMAALAYGLHRKSESQTIAVYDLGGGTFDVSIMEIGDGVFEVKSTNGDMFLGGEDIDFRLMDHVAGRFKEAHGVDLLADPVAKQRLKQASETAKIELSSLEAARIDLPFIHVKGRDVLHLEMMLDRATFDGLIVELVDRSLEVCAQALKDSALKNSEIDQIILVGGSTRIPLVQLKLQRFFGKPPYGGQRREDAVALGAAISAGMRSGDVKDVLLLDVTSLSLGIETMGGVFTRLIDRNTTIPTKKSQIFSTAEDGQRAVTINVYQGERELAADNKHLGRFDLSGIPPAPRGVPQIEVTFDIDANGIIHVSAKDKKTGKEQSIRITVSGGLSADEIEAMSIDAQRSGISLKEVATSAKGLPDTVRLNRRSEPIEAPPAVVAPSARVRATTGSVVPHIFLSYAHEDEKWAGAIMKSLSVLTRSGRANVWSDRYIDTGTRWEEQIYVAIEKANVANLLVSNDFLNSDFILSKELPAIFAEKERRQLALVPIIARPCA
ncbi:MAG: molecular chaperone DnaK, partial [Hyphomicrobiaceae bacterium]